MSRRHTETSVFFKYFFSYCLKEDVMSNLSFENLQDWRSAIKNILNLPELRFVGIICNTGCPFEGNDKKGIVPIAEIDQYKGDQY